MIWEHGPQITRVSYPDHEDDRFGVGFPAGAAGSSMEPMMSAPTGGRPGSHPDATEPWATRTRSPRPLPSTSKATSRSPDPVTWTSRKAPLGSPSIRLVDQTFPTTTA